MSGLAHATVTLVGLLGTAHIDSLADAYRPAPGFSAAHATHARQALPAPHHDQVDRLNRAWSQDPTVPGSAVALALEAAQIARHRVDVPRVEVVVTGPDSPAASVRLTSEVVRQLIDQATQRITVVSYAAYKMPAVIDALDAAVLRGVEVRLILESPKKLDGGGGAHAYAKFRTFHWPIDKRDPPEAKLHAKAVIVDSRNVLLTSANMTSAAYDKNIELGVVCRGGGVADQVQRHFDALIATGLLRQA